MSKVGTAYAQGLYSLAAEENLTQSILQQLQVLEQAFSAEPDFVRLLAAPNLSKQERCQILDDSLREKVHPYVLNFLKILTEKGYIRHFSDCCHAYEQQYNADHDILVVRAVTAQPMTDAQQQRLQQKLCELTGKTVLLKTGIDPDVLGGVRLDYNGKCVDGTVRNRMEKMRALLQNTV